MIERLTAGIDWLSMSMPRERVLSNLWLNDGIRAITAIEKEGQTLISRKLLGFEGVSAGNCFVGQNETHNFMQFCGHYADQYFTRLYDSSCKVSRLDIQVSVKYDVMPKNVAKECYRDSKRASDALPVGRKRKVWIIVGSDGGDTTYIGSASSEQRARIYNKEIQSDDPAYTRTWRFEVVFKNNLSTEFASQLSSGTVDRAEAITNAVSHWLSLRGIREDYIGTGGVVPLPIERTLPTDIERKLAWLETQVKPTIKYLCGKGFRDTLLLSLFPPEEN